MRLRALESQCDSRQADFAGHIETGEMVDKNVDKEDNISFWSQYAKHSPRERDWWTINSSKEKTIGCREHLETAIDVEMARGEVFLKTCVTVAEMKDLLNQLEDCKK